MYPILQGKVMDPFVIYKRTINYSSLKESLNEALFGKKVQKLSEVTQVRIKLYPCAHERSFPDTFRTLMCKKQLYC